MFTGDAGPNLKPGGSSPTLNPPFFLGSILMSSHLRLGLPSALFLSAFPTKIVNAFSRFSSACYNSMFHVK
jgi:hypothetical protein